MRDATFIGAGLLAMLVFVVAAALLVGRWLRDMK